MGCGRGANQAPEYEEKHLISCSEKARLHPHTSSLSPAFSNIRSGLKKQVEESGYWTLYIFSIEIKSGGIREAGIDSILVAYILRNVRMASVNKQNKLLFCKYSDSPAGCTLCSFCTVLLYKLALIYYGGIVQTKV